MTRLLTSLLRFFRQLSPPNQPLISPEQMRELFRQMLCDQEIRLSLKSIMGEAEPACVSANDPPASEVAGGDENGKFGTVAGGPRNYTFSADAATRVPLTVQGFAGQTAPLQNWKDSDANVLATVQGDGKVGIGTTEPSALLQVGSGGETGKLGINSQDFMWGQLQIGNPASNGEASIGFISGINSPFGEEVTSQNGYENMWAMGPGAWGIGGDRFVLGNGALDGPVITAQSNGNVGMGTTEPAEKLEVTGNIKCDGLNKIVFLAPRTDDGDDGAAINDAVTNKLPASGGIIMLTPGTTGVYHIHTTIRVTKSGVKLRGYGGNRDADPASSTLLQWVVGSGTPENEAVIRLGKDETGGYPQGLEISDLSIDGAGAGTPDAQQAEVGLELASVMNCVLRNVHVRNMRRSTNASISGGVGIRLTTYYATIPNPNPPPEPETIQVRLNCDWNYFINCSAWGCAKGVVLTNSEGQPAEEDNRNPSHNIFLGLDIRYWGDGDPESHGDVGLHLQVCDGNVFYRVWMQRLHGSDGLGWGVLIEHPDHTASNYFHQLVPSIGKSKAGGEGGSFLVKATRSLAERDHKNFILGYGIGDLAEAPLAELNGTRVDPSRYLYWLDEESRSHGVAKLATVGRPGFTPLRSPFTGDPYQVDVSSDSPTVVKQTPPPPPPPPPDPKYEARFVALIEVGDRISITTSEGEETRRVVEVTDNTHISVDVPFNGSATGAEMNLFPFLLRVADSSDTAKVLVSDLGDIRASGSADFGSLKIAGAEVISDERLLHDVLIPGKYPECAPRPLVDILGDFPSVLNWGATGDGVTDDRAAFQNAIDNCAGNLLVPPGTYMLSDYLEVPSNITIIGIGQPCLKLMAYRPFRTNLTPPTEPDFNAVITNADRENGNHHIRLVGLKLDGNGDSQYQTDPGPPPNPARGANLAVVLFNYVSFFEIVDCELTGGVSECFYALGGSSDPDFGTTHGIVSNCHIHDSGQRDVDSLGVHGDRVDGMVVSGCTLQNIGLRAIGFSKGTNVSVSGCTVINAQGAVQLGGTLHASISGVSGKDIRNDGITIALAPDSTAPLNITVAACSFQAKAGNTGYGVRIAGGNFVSVGNVAVRGFAHDGFRVESGYNSLSNVVASNCAGYGIRLTGEDATGCTVGSYRAYSCALGGESEDGGAAGNEWHSPRMVTEALALNINGEPCIGSSRDIDAHSMKVGTLTAGKPVFAGSDLVLASQDLDLLAAYIVNQLPVARGGTGADNAAGARWMLEVYGKSEVYTKAEVDALLANYVSLATYNAHGHWFGVPGHAHGGVTVGSGTSGEAGAYGNKTGGPY